MTLDLLGESGKILAVPGNGDAELWRYVGLRLPLLISRFLPFSVLLGTLIAFVGLNQHSEVVAMKAAGMSAHQILAPADRRQPRHRRAALRLQRDRSWSSPARAVNAWTDNDYRADPARKRDPQQCLGADRRRSRPRRHRRRPRRRHARRAGSPSTSARAASSPRVIEADTRAPAPGGGDWRLERRAHLRRRHERGPPGCPRSTALAGVTPSQLTLAKVDPDELDYLHARRRASPSSRPPAARPTRPAPAWRTRFRGRCRPC